MSTGKDSSKDYRYVEVRDELNELANLYIDLVKKFRRSIKRLSRESSRDDIDDLSGVVKIIEKIRMLRSRLRFLLEYLEKSLSREKIGSEIREDLVIIVSFFELSALRDEKSTLNRLIKLRPELEEELEKDLRDIEYIQGIATRIYVSKDSRDI